MQKKTKRMLAALDYGFSVKTFDEAGEDFADILASYTSKGLRVLAMGAKRMKMTYLQTQQIIRFRRKIHSRIIVKF